MNKSKHYIIYIVGFLLIAGGFFAAISNSITTEVSDNSSSVLSDTVCNVPNSSIFITSQNPSRIELKFDAQSLTGISRVHFAFLEGGGTTGSEKVIGKAVRESNQQLWRMIWDTNYFKPITAATSGSFRATVFFTNNTNCQTPATPLFSIPANQSFSPPGIEAVVNPPEWNTLVNTSINVNVDFINLPIELHPYVIVKWQPQIGFINSPYNRNTNYSSGPSSGSGKLRVNGVYAGQFFQEDIDVAVYSSTAVSDDDFDNSNSDDSTKTTNTTGSSLPGNDDSLDDSSDDSKDPLPEIDDDAELDDIITILAPKTPEPSQLTAPSRAIALILQSNEEIKSCVIASAGDSTLSNILRENRRPRGDEFNKIVNCFQQQRNVVPSILAPVAPEDVASESVPKSEAVTIKKLSNAKKLNEENSEQTTLVISGTAKSNSNVLLYVFSEPLVLATTADDNGEWTYTLEDPLETGKHEVYALVDRGDGVYESSNVTDFFIRPAEASEENPNGLSLELITEPTITANNRSANLYVAATIGIVVFAGVFMFSILLMKLKNKPSSQFAGPSLDNSSDDTSYKKFVDGK